MTQPKIEEGKLYVSSDSFLEVYIKLKDLGFSSPDLQFVDFETCYDDCYYPDDIPSIVLTWPDIY